MVSHAAFGIQRLMTYRRAGLPNEAALPPEARPVGVRYEGGLVALEGYHLRSWADTENSFLEVTLFWHGGQGPIRRELLARVNLLDAEGQQVYQVLDFPGEGLFPTSSWTSGMWLLDRFELKRPRPDTGPYTVSLTLFASDADAPLRAETADGARLPDDSLVISGISLPQP
jgi:hypothetical protein